MQRKLLPVFVVLAMALAGYYHDAYIGTVSVFFVLIMVQRFFGDASYAIIGPYLAEVWPNRLRASGMGFSYGIGNLGKIIGPLGTRGQVLTGPQRLEWSWLRSAA